jgi:hypothetical protein
MYELSFLFQLGLCLSLQILGTLFCKNGTVWYLSTFLKVLTMGTKWTCSFGPNLWRPINTRDTYSIFILDKIGCIEQGPIVQGPTLTGKHETRTCHHSIKISTPWLAQLGSCSLVFAIARPVIQRYDRPMTTYISEFHLRAHLLLGE